MLHHRFAHPMSSCIHLLKKCIGHCSRSRSHISVRREMYHFKYHKCANLSISFHLNSSASSGSESFQSKCLTYACRSQIRHRCPPTLSKRSFFPFDDFPARCAKYLESTPRFLVSRVSTLLQFINQKIVPSFAAFRICDDFF